MVSFPLLLCTVGAMSVALHALPMVQERSFKVFRGHEIMDWADNEFKFVVLIMGQGFCTGSIYNCYTVLTASHCASFIQPGTSKVEVERINSQIPKSRFFFPVEKFISNPDYLEAAKRQPINGFDVAVVTLEEKIHVSRFDLALPKFTSDVEMTVAYGTTVYIVGYGREREKNDRKGQLRWGRQEYVQCKDVMAGDPLCTVPRAQFNYQDTDVGDSGGPLVHKSSSPTGGQHTVMGTLSGGEDMQDGSFSIIYGSLHSSAAFVHANVKN